MKICPGLRVHYRRGQYSVLGMRAVIEHHRRPVLARVSSLDDAVHLDRCFGSVFVMDAHYCVAVVHKLDELPDVSRIQKIAVHKHSPSFKFRKIRREKTREGELCAFGWTSLAGEYPIAPQLGLLNGDDLDGEGRMLK